MKTVEQMLVEWEKATATETSRSVEDIIQLRRELVGEEFKEVDEELNQAWVEYFWNREISKRTKAELLKELCDLVYVVVGTAVRLGLPFDEGFVRVHANNMTKVVGDKVKRDYTGKVQKPEGYVKCDLSEIVE